MFLTPDAEHPIGQLNPAGYVTYGYVAAAVIFTAIMAFGARHPQPDPRLRVPPARKLTLRQLAREMIGTLSHKSFLVLMGAGLFNAMAGGLVLPLNLYFNTFFWQLPSGQIAILAAANFISSALAFGFAAPLSKRLGKKQMAQMTKVLSFVIAVTA